MHLPEGFPVKDSSKVLKLTKGKNHSNGKKTLIGIYVDDFIIFSNDKSETNILIEVFEQKFKIKNLGQVKQYLGILMPKYCFTRHKFIFN